MKLKIIGLLVAMFLVGCTDAQSAAWDALGSSQHIQCYSGGKLIYDGISTGKVLSEPKSDGYYFEDSKTHKLVETNANCLFMAE